MGWAHNSAHGDASCIWALGLHQLYALCLGIYIAHLSLSSIAVSNAEEAAQLLGRLLVSGGKEVCL